MEPEEKRPFTPPPLPQRNLKTSGAAEENWEEVRAQEKLRNRGVWIVLGILALMVAGAMLIPKLVEHTGLNKRLREDTKYVQENLPGVWLCDGMVMEVYPNGYFVQYQPVSSASQTEEPLLQEASVVIYGKYSLYDPDAYTQEEIEGFKAYAQKDVLIGVPCLLSYFGTRAEEQVFFRFLNSNTLEMGSELSLQRIGEVPEVTDCMTGLYVRKDAERFSLAVICNEKTQEGRMVWCNTPGELYTRYRDPANGWDYECRYDENALQSIDNSAWNFDYFKFTRSGTDLIDGGSGYYADLGAVYQKISDFSYCSQERTPLC